MRRTLTAVVAVTALFTLSGCFKLDMDLTVNADDTLDGEVIVAIEEDLAAMAGEESDMSPDEVPEGAKIEEYDEDGFVGQKVIFSDVKIDELNDSFATGSETGGPSGWKLTHEDGEYRFQGDMDMGDLAATEDGIDMGAFMEGAEMRVAITFPGKITDTNGKVDGKTVVWEPKIGEQNKMTAVAEESGGGLTLPVVITLAGVAVVVLGLLGVALGRGRRGGPDGGGPTENTSEPTPTGAA